MTKKLTEAQMAAITILAQPKRGGLTLEQVAEQVGVSDRSLRTWRQQDRFNAELKNEIMRKTLDRLPEVMESVPDHIINSGNAAMLRTLLQAHNLLSERVELTTDTKSTDMDAIKAEIARMKGQE